jgi:Uncharacterized conserved protein
MSIDFAYTLYLRLRKEGISSSAIAHTVQRWYVLSVLTGRYSNSPESTFYQDIKSLEEKGHEKSLQDLEDRTLSENFWKSALPQNLSFTSSSNPTYMVYLAAQIKDNDTSLLSNNVKTRDLISEMGDIHHIFPKAYLIKNGFTKNQYNQVANFAYLDNLVNKSIGDSAPNIYFSKSIEQCQTKTQICGSIVDADLLKKNFEMNCIPEGIETMTYENYDDFLEKRRNLMAEKIRAYYYSL